MKTELRIRHRRWLFWQQSGICYLQINQACRHRHGRMWCDVADGGLVLAKSSYATFEHVVPKAKVRTTPFVLLACKSCNQKKGTEPPTDEQLARAKTLWKQWLRVHAAQRAPVVLRMRKIKSDAQAHQLMLEEHYAKRRKALGLDALGATAKEREKTIRRLISSTSMSLGR